LTFHSGFYSMNRFAKVFTSALKTGVRG
jgi:hypothetical protein